MSTKLHRLLLAAFWLTSTSLMSQDSIKSYWEPILRTGQTPALSHQAQARDSVGAQRTVLAVGGASGRIFGGTGAGYVTAASLTLPAGTIKPNALLRLEALFDFSGTSKASRRATFRINGVSVGQVSMGASMKGLNLIHPMWVSPDCKAVMPPRSNWFNKILAPATALEGAPYGANNIEPQYFAVDLSGEVLLELRVGPANGDSAELMGWCLEQFTDSSEGVVNRANSTGVLMFGDSLTAGAGSVAGGGGFFLETTANTTSGSTGLSSVGGVTGVLAKMLVSGPGIQPDTVVTAVSAGSITLSKQATATATGITIKVSGGSLPSQMRMTNAGQPIVQAGIGGETSVQIVDRLVADSRSKTWGVHLECGRNDVYDANFQSVVLAQIARAVAHIGHQRYSIMTVSGADENPPNSASGLAIQALNTQIKALYGAHVCDMWSIISGGTGVMVPDSDFIQPDGLHFKDLGYAQLVAPLNVVWTAQGMK